MHNKPAEQNEELDQLLERAILAYESEGHQGVERVLASEPQLAADVRMHIDLLQAKGMLLAPHSPEVLPDRIGPYRVLELLGYGGMGAVYLAEQEGMIHRRVAVKVIRPGMDTAEVLARFAIERQALAIVDHPHIAKVFDAGSTEAGQPYLVMEFVAGRALTEYCREKSLIVERRLELFAQVCETVQHAHQSGIVHRDLKPSNVLVCEREGKPWPMIIDFGFAKALQPVANLESVHTAAGRVLGTPEYMSPEQAAYRLDLDTRTDVYSLGVILYELLTGRLPFDSKRLRTASPTELERILTDESPLAPSSIWRNAVHDRAMSSSGVAELSSSSSLHRRLREDLDTIILKAIAKDRDRRYAMAIELANDIRRCLACEPILAVAPSNWYRFRRYAERHRWLVGSVALAGASLLIATVVSVQFARSSHRSEGVAESAREIADANLSHALDAVERMLRNFSEGHLRAVPQMEEVRRAMLEEALQLCLQIQGTQGGRATTIEVARSQGMLARIYGDLGRHSEARRTAKTAIASLTTLVTEKKDDTKALLALAEAWDSLGTHYDGLRTGEMKEAMAEAVRCFQELVDRADKSNAPIANRQQSYHRLAASLHNYANALFGHDSAKAVPYFERSLAAVNSALALGSDPKLVRLAAMTHASLVKHMFVLGKLAEAEAAARAAKALLDELSPSSSTDPETKRVAAHVSIASAQVHIATGQPELGVAPAQAAVKRFVELSQDHPQVEEYRSYLAMSHSILGSCLPDQAAALGEMRLAVSIAQSLVTGNPEQPDHAYKLASYLFNLAVVLRQSRQRADLPERQRSLQTAKNLLAKLNTDPAWQTTIGELAGNVQLDLARVNWDLEDLDAAMADYKAVSDSIQDRSEPSMSTRLLSLAIALRGQAMIALHTGRCSEAVELARRAEVVQKELDRRVGSDGQSKDEIWSLCWLSLALVRHGEIAEGTSTALRIQDEYWVPKSLKARVFRDAYEIEPDPERGRSLGHGARKLYQELVDVLGAQVGTDRDDLEAVAYLGCAAIALAELDSELDPQQDSANLVELGIGQLRRAKAEAATIAPVAESIRRGMSLQARLDIANGNIQPALALVEEMLAIATGPQSGEWLFAAACIVGHGAMADGAKPELRQQATALLSRMREQNYRPDRSTVRRYRASALVGLPEFADYVMPAKAGNG